MRKTLLICFLLCFQISFAQLEKKTWLLGGDASYDRYDNRSNSTLIAKGNHLDLSLNNGYFFLNKLAMGVRVSVENAVSKYRANPDDPGTEQRLRQTIWGIGPFVRYYLLSAQKPVNLFAETSAMNSRSSYNSYGNASNLLSVSGAAGTAIFLNKTIALEFIVAYEHSNSEDYDDEVRSLQFKAGFQIHLNNTKKSN
jgi:hypothetical protein